jgi:hypothetical protein
VCPREEVLAALKAILAATEFARSESLSRLLEHLVTNTLDGRAEDLKESNLGSDVFRRGPDFDPRVDNIVRVQARNLRQRLAAYYTSPRIGVRIDIPTGSYVPLFRRIPGASKGALSGEAEEAGPDLRRPPARSLNWWTVAVVATTAFLGGLVYGRRLAKPTADVSSAGRVSLLAIPIVAAGGDPEEARIAMRVSRLVRARLPGVAGIRVVDARPPVGFVIDGSARRAGNRIALTLSLSGDREQRGLGLRCSLTGQDDVADADSLAGVLVERMMLHVRDVLAGNPRAGPAWGAATADFDASNDFTPPGKVASNGHWSYGWEQVLGGPFRLYNRSFQVKYWGVEVIGWSQSGEGPQNGDHCCPFAAKNISGHDLREQMIAIPANQMWLHPGPRGEFSVVHWKGSAVGRYEIEARFSALTVTTTDVHVLKNGAPLTDGAIDGLGVWQDVLIRNLSCEPNDTIDFAVGFGANRNYNSDITGLDARIMVLR